MAIASQAEVDIFGLEYLWGEGEGILNGNCIRSNETLSILLLVFHAHQIL